MSAVEQQPAPPVAAPAVLEARSVSKRFSGVEALRNVSISVREGEVLGLVGENGAGKSTLLSVLSGSLRADEGSVHLRGEEVDLRSYVDANLRGIFRAHQDQSLLANMTVADNMFLGHESRFSTFGVLRRGLMTTRAEEHLERELHGASARTKVGELPLDVRQMVEIIRAFAVAELLGTGKPVILLDETTASLNLDEVQDLYRYIRRQRGDATFVFVSHRLKEVLELSDRIYVMKDGALVGELQPGETNEEKLHQLMVGRVRSESYYLEDLHPSELGPPLLQVEGLSAEPHFRDVSLGVRRGEIFALGGVTGSGKSELARAIAGDLKITHGKVTVDAVSLPASGTRNRVGLIAYGPLDRHRDGVSLHQSVRLNVTLSCLDELTPVPGVLSRSAERDRCRSAIDRYEIVTPDEDCPVANLSGGNQQKVMLARLAGSNCEVLVLDNPTRGVDAGARQEIYLHLRRMAKSGVAILLVTDDLPELIGMGDRLGIMRDGQLVHVYQDTRALTEEQVVARMV